MYQFPKDLYCDVRIEENYASRYSVQNDDVLSDSASTVTGAMIRVFDGTMWYTASTNNIDGIQAEINNLAMLATPNPDILKHPVVAAYETNTDTVLQYSEDNDIRKVSREERIALVNHYISSCVDKSIPEQTAYGTNLVITHRAKQFYSSKGAALSHDQQFVTFSMFFLFTVDGIPNYGYSAFTKNNFQDLYGLEETILTARDKDLDYARHAVPVAPGNYTCVLSPNVTSFFTHESFGHKSEADYMLNDKTLQEEWVLGKKVGNEKVTISDAGNIVGHGYVPYDDEGTKATETFLIKDGILTGRLHDAKSAVTLQEAPTGNSRAQNYFRTPIVRMTNTYMLGGPDDPEEIIKGVKDGIYVARAESGSGMSTFTLNPDLCYRIRDGKICEPLRVSVITGNVFRTLFDIDAVGNDFTVNDCLDCGKNGQSAWVSAGGPTIRIKSLNVN